MRTFFDRSLDTGATFWRVYRRDGVTLGFTTHDNDIRFAGINHRAAPGMVPSAIRTTIGFSDESAGVEGALSHSAISDADLSAGLFDQATIEIGIVDWETREHQSLYSGTLGRIENSGTGFTAELNSAKVELERDLVPRTSPTCRAEFCGLGCGLSAERFSHRYSITDVDFDLNRIRVDAATPSDFLDGQVRMLNGPQTGVKFSIIAVTQDWMTLDRPLVENQVSHPIAELRQGCDHTHSTCSGRFNNAVNFRGEPFLPGNDLLARYGQPSG